MKKCYITYALAVTAIALLFISCAGTSNESLADYDIAKIYGYTYYGNITASSGNTLIPSLIVYNDNRCDWNMNVTGMNNNQFYYYATQNSASNYTLYWFSAADHASAIAKDASKAAMVVQVGINSLDEIVILLTGDKLTGISAMANTRVPMKKQANIPRNTTPTEIDYNASIKDIMIERPEGASRAAWGGNDSYNGSFVYLVGEMQKGKGSCGTDADGNMITPVVKVADTSATTANTVQLTMYRFAFSKEMTIKSFDIPNVEVYKDGATYYLHLDATSSIQAETLDKTITLKDLTVDGKLDEKGMLTLRVSFKPGKMPFPIIEIFTST
ncbi:MAG: hypothetical protein J6I73_08890 [Treponema sp.]|nr:hypothetical protein [Treponema sp.]